MLVVYSVSGSVKLLFRGHAILIITFSIVRESWFSAAASPGPYLERFEGSVYRLVAA